MKVARGVKRKSVQRKQSALSQPVYRKTGNWPLCSSGWHLNKCHDVAIQLVDFTMPRWIAFDQLTSSLLRRRLAQEDRIETFGRGALDYALAKPGAVVTLLPSSGSDVGIAVFRPPRVAKAAARPAAAPARSSPVAATTRAGGFLGLSDEPIFEEEQPVQQKKGWWRKFWDE